MLKKPFSITIIWALLILLICLIPGNNISKFNRIDVPYLDKLIHFFMYLVLSILLVSTIRRSSIYNKKPILAYFLIVLAAVTYGGIIELLQNYDVFARDSDHLDFFANTAGVISGLFIYFLLKNIINKIQSRG